jgi:DNA/RNA endonuclease G (NUC1)
MIEIRNGCKPVQNTNPNIEYWIYEDAKSTGIVRVTFTAPIGIIPRIGDYIDEDAYVWVPRTEYKIVPNVEPQFPDDDEFTFRR